MDIYKVNITFPSPKLSFFGLNNNETNNLELKNNRILNGFIKMKKDDDIYDLEFRNNIIYNGYIKKKYDNCVAEGYFKEGKMTGKYCHLFDNKQKLVEYVNGTIINGYVHTHTHRGYFVNGNFTGIFHTNNVSGKVINNKFINGKYYIYEINGDYMKVLYKKGIIDTGTVRKTIDNIIVKTNYMDSNVITHSCLGMKVNINVIFHEDLISGSIKYYDKINIKVIDGRIFYGFLNFIFNNMEYNVEYKNYKIKINNISIVVHNDSNYEDNFEKLELIDIINKILEINIPINDEISSN
jgi:hypothetical protein